MPVLGEIARQARLRMPATWESLSKDGSYGEDGLQVRVDTVKALLAGEVVPHDEEVAEYGAIGCMYAGVVMALDLVPEAYDHWMTAATSWGASGRNENKTFVDRAESLLKWRDEILAPLEVKLYPLVVDVFPGIVARRTEGVILSRLPDGTEHITPDPGTFERPFEAPRGVAA